MLVRRGHVGTSEIGKDRRFIFFQHEARRRKKSQSLALISKFELPNANSLHFLFLIALMVFSGENCYLILTFALGKDSESQTVFTADPCELNCFIRILSVRSSKGINRRKRAENQS